MSEKRGLSGVVTTIIIILLALVAIGIIWGVVKNLAQKGSEQIELGQFSLDLQIKKVQVENENVTVIVVKRNAGEGNFVGMNFVFSDGQNSEIIRQNTSLQELEEKTFTFTLTKISTSNLKIVSVAPIYELSSGKEKQGNTVATFEVKNIGTGTGGAVSEGNFAELGYSGAGTKEYTFSSNEPKIPKFKKATIDPLDVAVGDDQTITVIVYSPNTISSVTAKTQLDNEFLTLNLEKISQDLNGENWSVTWIVYDTHITTYRTTITAIDSAGNQNNITLTWTDNCAGITQGQDSTLSGTTCTLGTGNIGGLDGGSLTVPSGFTLTIDSDSTWAFNPGKSITVTGTIAVNGQISKGYLYHFDSDGDTKSVNASLLFLTTQFVSSPYQRAMDVVVTSDCNDDNSSLWTTGYGTNYDGDGYGLASSSGCNNGANPFNATTGASDCNDASADDWRLRYGDSDGDGHCPVETLVCVGNQGGYTNSCSDFGNDCDDSNGAIYQNPGSCSVDGDCCPGYACSASQCAAV